MSYQSITLVQMDSPKRWSWTRWADISRMSSPRALCSWLPPDSSRVVMSEPLFNANRQQNRTRLCARLVLAVHVHVAGTAVDQGAGVRARDINIARERPRPSPPPLWSCGSVRVSEHACFYVCAHKYSTNTPKMVTCCFVRIKTQHSIIVLYKNIQS